MYTSVLGCFGGRGGRERIKGKERRVKEESE
jgi:hypothetical protein